MKRVCLGGCGHYTTEGSRCSLCRKAQRAKYAGSWQRDAAKEVEYHVSQHGWLCPGFGATLPHESHDLTVDHQLGVLCRGCNSRKRNLGQG